MYGYVDLSVLAACKKDIKEAYSELFQQMDEFLFYVIEGYIVSKGIVQDSATHRRYWEATKRGVLEALKDHDSLIADIPFGWFASAYMVRGLREADKTPIPKEDLMPSKAFSQIRGYRVS